MTRIQRLLISLPLLLLPMTTLAHRPALAGELSASQGLELLAMTSAASSRCHVLSWSESSELSRYRKRAEVAAANLLDSSSREQAIASGTAKGRVAQCTPQLAADIRETLKAAREAVAAADGRPAPQAHDPAPAPEPVVKSKPSGNITLADYGDIIKPYYGELRCHVLGRSQAVRYWRGIQHLQKSMVGKYGTGAVGATQGSARRAAQFMSCGSVAAKAASAMARF